MSGVASCLTSAHTASELMDRWNSYALDSRSGRVEFMFLGQRNYVHGTSMLDAILETLKTQAPQCVSEKAWIKTFRVIEEFSSGARVHVAPTPEIHAHPLLKQAAARLDIMGGGRPWTGFLVPDPAITPLGRHSDYDSADYVARIQPLDDGGDWVGCTNVHNRIDLIRSIIEGMRQIEWRDHGGDDATITRMRWGYLSGFRLLADAEAAQAKAFALSAPRVMGVPGQEFSIRKIQVQGLDCGQDAEMCFFSAFVD